MVKWGRRLKLEPRAVGLTMRMRVMEWVCSRISMPGHPFVACSRISMPGHPFVACSRISMPGHPFVAYYCTLLIQFALNWSAYDDGDKKSSTFAKLKVPIGPSHPALEEPARFLFDVEGEKVVDVDYEIGYNHRSIERLCQERPMPKIVYLVERICGICSHAHPLNHVERVEDIADIEVPARAKYIRTIYAELERIHSHMLWAGIAGEEIGYHTLFMYTWREREKVMDLFEMLSGNRVMHGCNQIGGVKWNISDEQARSALGVLAYLDTAADKITKSVLKDSSIAERCKGVGCLSKEDAIRLGAVGPNARADSGVAEDTRVMCSTQCRRFRSQATGSKRRRCRGSGTGTLGRTQTIHWAHQGAYRKPA